MGTPAQLAAICVSWRSKVRRQTLWAPGEGTHDSRREEREGFETIRVGPLSYSTKAKSTKVRRQRGKQTRTSLQHGVERWAEFGRCALDVAATRIQRSARSLMNCAGAGTSREILTRAASPNSDSRSCTHRGEVFCQRPNLLK